MDSPKKPPKGIKPDGAEQRTDRKFGAPHKAENKKTPPIQSITQSSDICGDAFLSASTLFSKGLQHDQFGRVKVKDMQDLISELQSTAAPDLKPLLYCGGYTRPSGGVLSRKFESPFSAPAPNLKINGVTPARLRPPPDLGSADLTLELAEVFGAALLRDVPFCTWSTDARVSQIHTILSTLSTSPRCKETRNLCDCGALFRGSTRGAQSGPFVSQFLLVGNAEQTTLAQTDSEAGPVAAQTASSQDCTNRAARFVPAIQPPDIHAPVRQEDGFIRYGAQSISQRYHGHLRGLDYVTEWASWLDVQNGSNRKDAFDRFEPKARFLSCPRDLATYVHFAGRSQAFVNAGLILMGAEEPVETGFPEGAHHPTRDASATFGQAHLLSLLAQVELAVLRTVFHHKFQTHLRARPERTAAAIAIAWAAADPAGILGQEFEPVTQMQRRLLEVGLLDRLSDHNRAMNQFWQAQYGEVDLGPLSEEQNALLPLAWPEGSPMHPGFGSAQAAVAGACATVLKGFFEMFAPAKTATPPLPDAPQRVLPLKVTAPPYPDSLFGAERTMTGAGSMLSAAQIADPATDFVTLTAADACPRLSLQGEIDKLADNIALAGLFAGVIFHSDYFGALRLGERIAVSVLRQHLCDFEEPVSMRFHTFDGEPILILNRPSPANSTSAEVFLWTRPGAGSASIPFEAWYGRTL